MNAAVSELMPRADALASPIAEYNATAAALAELRTRYEGAEYEVGSTAGMKAAKGARAELRGLRTDLEAKRKELKQPVLERGRLIDDEAKRITAELVALENPIDEQIKAEERRREEERAERERQEAARLAAINDAIEKIRARPLAYITAPADVVRGVLREMLEAVFPHFDDVHRPRAEAARDYAVDQLTGILDERLQAEKLAEEQRIEQERLAAERAELERQREEQEAAQREAEAAAQAEQERIDAERREQQRIEDEQRAERQRQEDADREAERQRLAEERAELEREAAAQREAAAESQRKAEARAIERATLSKSAHEAVELLVELGQGEHLVTRKLAAALAREAKA